MNSPVLREQGLRFKCNEAGLLEADLGGYTNLGCVDETKVDVSGTCNSEPMSGTKGFSFALCEAKCANDKDCSGVAHDANATADCQKITTRKRQAGDEKMQADTHWKASAVGEGKMQADTHWKASAVYARFVWSAVGIRRRAR